MHLHLPKNLLARLPRYLRTYKCVNVSSCFLSYKYVKLPICIFQGRVCTTPCISPNKRVCTTPNISPSIWAAHLSTYRLAFEYVQLPTYPFDYVLYLLIFVQLPTHILVYEYVQLANISFSIQLCL